MAELEAHETPAGFQHAVGLLKRPLLAADIPEAESDGVGIELHLREGEILGIAADPVEAGEQPLIDRTVAADLQHRRGEIADRHGCAGLPLQDAESDIAGATRHIEAVPVGPRVQPVQHRRFPQAMDAAGHQIVHQIVFARDRGKDALHQTRLFALGNTAIAEPGGAGLGFCLGIAGILGRHLNLSCLAGTLTACPSGCQHCRGFLPANYLKAAIQVEYAVLNATLCSQMFWLNGCRKWVRKQSQPAPIHRYHSVLAIRVSSPPLSGQLMPKPRKQLNPPKQPAILSSDWGC